MSTNSISNICLSNSLSLLISYCSAGAFYDSIFAQLLDAVDSPAVARRLWLAGDRYEGLDQGSRRQKSTAL